MTPRPHRPLRHELPLTIGHPFLYLEYNGRRAVLTNAIEETRIARAAPDVERLLVDAFGRDELIAAGHPWSVGGVGVEDLLVVADGGSERLTGDFPYGLVP
ncbi:MAG TPA: hypothetical protein VMG37_08745 [Solirubrobacteraceae bacterium]|nr:hypothetical protein [Solirubrobacteraceae bacterium]